MICQSGHWPDSTLFSYPIANTLPDSTMFMYPQKIILCLVYCGLFLQWLKQNITNKVPIWNRVIYTNFYVTKMQSHSIQPSFDRKIHLSKSHKKIIILFHWPTINCGSNIKGSSLVQWVSMHHVVDSLTPFLLFTYKQNCGSITLVGGDMWIKIKIN